VDDPRRRTRLQSLNKGAFERASVTLQATGDILAPPRSKWVEWHQLIAPPRPHHLS